MERSLNYFNIGAEALRRFHNLPDSYYACPGCLRMFGVKDVNQLTLEHAPQKSAGGRKICLTCFDCNSNAGYKIDAHLDRREKGLSFFSAILERGSYEGTTKVKVMKSLVNAILKANDTFVEFTADPSNNDPIEHAKLQEELVWLKQNGSWEGQRIDFKLHSDSYNKHKAMVADLKTAYLACFAKLGYQYILRPQLDIVRIQILQPELKLIDGFAYRTRPGLLPIGRVIIFVETPFHATVVQIDDRFLFLPPIDHSENFYDSLPQHLSADLQLNGVETDFPTTMEMELDRIEIAAS